MCAHCGEEEHKRVECTKTLEGSARANCKRANKDSKHAVCNKGSGFYLRTRYVYDVFGVTWLNSVS